MNDEPRSMTPDRGLRWASELRDLCRALAGPRLKRTSLDVPNLVREGKANYKSNRTGRSKA